MDNLEEYNKSHDLQLRDAKDVIEEFTDELAEMHGTCVDIGCGPGSVTKDHLLPKLPNDTTVVGADISEKMLNYAKSTCLHEKRLSFVEVDLEAAELPADVINRFDNATSFHCLHWCKNTRRALSNIYKMLRPGGKALISLLAYNDGFDAYVRMCEDPRYRPYMKDVDRFVPFFHHCANPRATLKKMLEEAGFEVQHCSRREKTFIFKNMQILRGHALAVNPFLNRIPEELVEEFKDDTMRELSSEKIFFTRDKNKEAKDEYSILDIYTVLIAYFKKPLHEKEILSDS